MSVASARIGGDLEVGVRAAATRTESASGRVDVGAGVDAPRRRRAALRAAVSMRVMRACACGLRSIAACTMPGSAKSSVYVRGAGEQARIFAAPDARAEDCGVLIASPPRHRVAASLHRAHDVLVAGAAAQVAFEPVADLFVASDSGSARSSSCVARIMPGVQKPHCSPCLSQNASCSGCSVPSGASPSMVVIDAPSACTARQVHDLTATPSSSTVQAPHWLVSQPTLVPVRPPSSRRKWTSSSRGSTSRS